MADDFYTTLGVPRTAEADAIKKAYKKLARDLHPDKNPGNKAVETRFKAVNRAYDALGDAKKRKLYDEFGEDALREGFDPDKARAYKQWQGGGGGGNGFPGGGQRINIEDLFGGGGGGGFGGGGADPFADLFGRRGRTRGPMRGQDYEQELSIDFDSAVKGTTLEIRSAGSTEPVTVRIPPGADEGSRVRIAGQGGQSPNGGPAGDLILLIHVKAHAFFERKGNDLYVDVPITVTEAIRGAKVKVPTTDGMVTVKVPPGTQSGTVLRVRGKGIAKKGKDPGDLYPRFMIHVPGAAAATSPEVVAALEAIEPFEPKDLRNHLER